MTPDEPRTRSRTIFKPRTRRPNFLVSVGVMAVRLAFILILMAGVAGVGVVLGIVKAYTETAPTLNLAVLDSQAQTSFFYDAEGNVLTDYKGSEDRVMVSVDTMPVLLQRAFVAVEDERFYQHNGVDVKRILGSFVNNFSGGQTQGGSTITQQVIKMSVLSDEQSYKRKIQEAYLAMQLENVYSKDQILEAYLNTLYLGENYYGVKTAAYGYFGKELSELTLRECAMLAGSARYPYYYNPRRNFFTRSTPDITNQRTDYALRKMYENEFITAEEYRAALDPITAVPLKTHPGLQGGMYPYAYYVEYAVQDVINVLLERNQLANTTQNRNAMETELRTGGYHVYLCIDTNIQKIVEDTLSTFKDYPALRDPSLSVFRQSNPDGTYTELIEPQAAAVILDYRTGELKAIVGGRTAPTARKTLNRATDMKMPVGSAIKPISVYGPAVEMGAGPATILYNMPVPIHGWNDGTGKDYYPSNYGGGGFSGPITMRNAIRSSYNTAAAQTLMHYVGVDRSQAFLEGMGVAKANINANPFGLALGSSGLTPVQMAGAFGTLANGGIYQEPMSFSRIEDADGNILIDRRVSQLKRIVFSEATSWLMVDMMKGVVSNGTATSAKISGQTVAGKTGTNSDYKGITFTGMTGYYVGSVWIGHDNYVALSSKATGGAYAAPLWQTIMTRAHQGLADRDIIAKDAAAVGLVRVTTCGVSGLLATQACQNDIMGYKTVTDYWAEANAPRDNCNMHQSLLICADSGLLATAFCPNTQTKSAIIIPMGHPLYDYIGEYANVMRDYLGEFATLRFTNDSAYNDQLIAQATCPYHTDIWSQEQVRYEYNDTISEAQGLVQYAYSTLIDRGASISAEDYVQVSYCIRQVETILSSSTMSGLDVALNALRAALSVFQ